MRISDWSSDVCSSDLARAPRFAPVKALLKRQPVQYLRGLELDDIVEQQRRKRVADRQCGVEAAAESLPHFLKRLGIRRSEEHTSELQSLMRISYAVFCLKKKIKNHKSTYHINM